jgi:DNA-binding HxlR family transcriptional regulator
MGKVPDNACAITRTLGVLGERWTILILREAVVMGSTRFSEFQKSLGIAPDVLTDRLNTLVAHGVMEKRPYRNPGERSRFSYAPTDAGKELAVLLGALQQWGDEHLPWPEGPSMLRRVDGSDVPVHVGFVDDQGREVDRDKVAMIRTAAYPSGN